MRVSGLVVVLTLLLATAAHAQCSKDTDCKGDRVCVEGSCQAPASVVQPAPVYVPAPAYVPASPPRAEPRAHTGWAMGAGVTGLVSAGLVTALGATAGVVNGQVDTAVTVGIGGLATVLFLAAVPIVAIGDGSARSAQSPGLLGLRVTSWILYGLAGAAAIVDLTIGITGGSVPSSMIYGITALGAGSTVLMSVDALITAGQARSALAETPTSGVFLAPVLSAARLADGRAAPVVGLGGSF